MKKLMFCLAGTLLQLVSLDALAMAKKIPEAQIRVDQTTHFRNAKGENATTAKSGFIVTNANGSRLSLSYVSEALAPTISEIIYAAAISVELPHGSFSFVGLTGSKRGKLSNIRFGCVGVIASSTSVSKKSDARYHCEVGFELFRGKFLSASDFELFSMPPLTYYAYPEPQPENPYLFEETIKMVFQDKNNGDFYEYNLPIRVVRPPDQFASPSIMY